MLDEGGHEMLARLLAVTDDIDAGMLLLLQRQAQRIRLASISSSPCSFQGDQSFSGSASQAGLAGCRRWRWAKFFHDGEPGGGKINGHKQPTTAQARRGTA
jgi:hypothetical protein